MKVGVISLGCSKNLVNTEQMMYLLKEAGFEITHEISDVDFVLLNTCGFIEGAKTEAIDTIIELGEMKQRGEIGKIIVAGCLSERYKKEIMSELPEIDAVVGTGSFDDIISAFNALIKSDDKNNVAIFGDINAPVSETKRIISTSPSWAYLKIAEGCDNNCAYCVIPSIRGRFRSRPMENIINEAKTLVARGVKELIIVAQDVTMYGVDLYKSRMLTTLLKQLCDIEGLKWIRLHYLYPGEIDDNLIDFISIHDKILKYLDIPIQHINSDILKKMNRRGTGEEIRELFRRIRERIPGVVLRTGIITGLPGESDEAFDELCNFLREAKIERAGIFQYSPEEGSLAAEMDRPGEEIAAKRAQLLTDLQSRIMEEYDLSRVGSIVPVLIEGRDESGLHVGRSFAESPDVDGYITIESTDIAEKDFIKVKITSASDGIIKGTPI